MALAKGPSWRAVCAAALMKWLPTRRRRRRRARLARAQLANGGRRLINWTEGLLFVISRATSGRHWDGQGQARNTSCKRKREKRSELANGRLQGARVRFCLGASSHSFALSPSVRPQTLERKQVGAAETFADLGGRAQANAFNASRAARRLVVEPAPSEPPQTVGRQGCQSASQQG